MGYDAKQLQQIILIIAKEIKRICDENNIDYSLAGGSLLGAVRHKGFIPWDDDMDIMMRREEYDRFRKCCKTQLDERFMLIDWNNDPYYGNCFLKIMLKDTLAYEKGKINDKCPHCVYVDVFPFDYVAPTAFGRFRQKWVGYFCIRLIQEKSGSTRYKNMHGLKKAQYFIYHEIQRLFPREQLINICEKQMRKYNRLNSREVTCIGGQYGYSHETIPADWLDQFVALSFENIEFKAISKYDEYLKQFYGDYMTLPPKDKRVAHRMELVDFGKYETSI